jgi:hypothetical protein
MMRNLIVLGCSALLAIALGATSYAGAVVDTDSDGVADTADNCDEIPNAAGGATDNCDAQEDDDADGFGNTCDTDVNQDLTTSIADVSATLAESKLGSPNLAMDFNCDEAVSVADISRALADSKIPASPGPACDNPIAVPCP